MKRILAVFLVVLICIASVFAGGDKEGATDSRMLASFVREMSALFDYATTELCLAVHPFPSVLYAFTDINDSNEIFDGSGTYGILQSKPLSQISESEFLLSSDSRNTFSANQLGNIFFTEENSDGSRIKLYRGLAAERETWSVVTYLFAIFTVLEVLYVTIRGYLVDEENLIRKIITRLLVTGILFLVLMALPALVELFRIGFFELAKLVTTPIVFTDVTEADSIFELPGGVLRCTSKLLQNMGPDSLGWDLDGSSQFSTVSASFFKQLVMRILYVILDIFVMVLSLLSAFQIMMNIVEVYILLAIVVCLLPFQVFSGTRYLVGENMIKSLFTNIIELFVIMIIIGMTANAAVSMSKIGTLYISNGSYFPVVITLDTSKLYFGTGVFTPTGGQDQGLSIEFSSFIPDSELGNEPQTTAKNIILNSFYNQYYVDNENIMRNIDDYKNPTESTDANAKVYLSGDRVFGGLSYITDNYIKYIKGENEGETTTGTESFAVNVMLDYLTGSGFDYFQLSNDSSGNTKVAAIKAGLLAALRGISEVGRTTITRSNSYWKGSIQLQTKFDIKQAYGLNNGKGTYKRQWIIDIPVENAKITLICMLGESIDSSFEGNYVIDSRMETFLNACMNLYKDPASDNDLEWKHLSILQKKELVARINAAVGDAITVSSDLNILQNADLTTEQMDPSWGILLMHFFVSIMAALMQVYFIKKSSAITNALQSGSASMDRTQALTRMITGAAAKAAMLPVTAPVAALGGAASKALDSREKGAPLNDTR